MQKIERPADATSQATESLRTAILAGDLVPGEIYSATELGKELGVSRTPVREAVQQLARMGMVIVERNRGIRVLPTSPESLQHAFEIRIMLEVPLSALAAQFRSDEDLRRVKTVYENFEAATASGDAEATLRADRDFHTAILLGAGNPRAVKLLEEQRNLVLLTGIGTVPTSRTAEECFEDHRDLFTGFVEGSMEKTRQAMGKHILNTANLLFLQEERRRPGFAAGAAIERLSCLL